MIRIARGLKEPFGTAEIVMATGMDVKKAGNILTQWKLKKWVNTVGRGEYNRAKGFGGTFRAETSAPRGTGEQILEQIHKEIDAAKPKED